jgi:adenylate cyclase
MGVLHHFAVSCYFERDYAAAVAAAKRVIRTYPEFPRALPFLVASLAQVGQIDEARRALDDAPPAARALFDRHLQSRPPSCSQEDYEHLLEGLRKAGCHG